LVRRKYEAYREMRAKVSGRGVRRGGGRGEKGSVGRDGDRRNKGSKYRSGLENESGFKYKTKSKSSKNKSRFVGGGNRSLKKDDLGRDARRSRVGRGASGRSWIGGSGERASGAEIAGCKERGEWAELCFMERAARHGLRVSKPHGDSAPYDVVVEWGGRFRRVQVKSTIYRRRGESYSLNVMGPGRRAYKEDSFDFAAVYLIPVDTWYIIPFGEMGEGRCSLHFKPGGMRQKYDRFREAWELLKGGGSPRAL